MKRTHYCNEVTTNEINTFVYIAGWVNTRRDLGGLIFLDIRDRSGIVQVVINPQLDIFNIASDVKNEYVVRISGIVKARPNANKNLLHGNIEIVATGIDVLNTAIDIPITLNENNSEINRLKYRVLDLRSKKMQYNIILKSKVTQAVREFLNANGFLDIETPVLTRSTPGGANDFLVPSRMNAGMFYGLAQSPQLFKQMLMIAGFDRYYQLAKCFRDEDLRSDRQPEFTQIDIETSFLSEEEIRSIAEWLMQDVFKNVLGVDLGIFPVMTYKDAMYYYGCDKPDLRFDMKFFELKNVLQNTSFQPFQDAVHDKNSRIIAIKVNSNLSSKKIDELKLYLAEHGGTLSFIKIKNTEKNSDSISSPLKKVITEYAINAIVDCVSGSSGDTVFIMAGHTKTVNNCMNLLRLTLGKDTIHKTTWAPLWITDFPLFEFEENRYYACHHPFTAPKDVSLLKTSPATCLAQAYDMVLNGSEIGGGSIRIHNKTTQAYVFSILNISEKEARDKFGFLLDNLEFGTPPHGGIAFGLDRIIALMSGSDSIRDVIAFPKTTQGRCLLTNAPGYLDSSNS